VHSSIQPFVEKYLWRRTLSTAKEYGLSLSHTHTTHTLSHAYIQPKCAQDKHTSQGYCLSKSKSNFQNGLTIQFKSNHNPIIFGKRYIGHQILIGQVLSCNHGIPKTNFFQLTTFLINWLFENFYKKSSACLLEHNPLWNFNFLIR